MKKKIPEKYEKTYGVRLNCLNCRKWINVRIPLGVKLLYYLKTNTCENCGCMFCKNLSEFKLVFITTLQE
jgi:hypothetical protein